MKADDVRELTVGTLRDGLLSGEIFATKAAPPEDDGASENCDSAIGRQMLESTMAGTPPKQAAAEIGVDWSVAKQALDDARAEYANAERGKGTPVATIAKNLHMAVSSLYELTSWSAS